MGVVVGSKINMERRKETDGPLNEPKENNFNLKGRIDLEKGHKNKFSHFEY